MRGTNLARANLQDANLKGANLEDRGGLKANLEGATLKVTLNLFIDFLLFLLNINLLFISIKISQLKK